MKFRFSMAFLVGAAALSLALALSLSFGGGPSGPATGRDASVTGQYGIEPGALAGQRPVLLLTQRYGQKLHILDPSTLEPLGSVSFGEMTESALAVAGVPRVFLRLGQGKGCCGLYALDLRSLEVCPLASPAVSIAGSAEAGQVFLTRGSVGVDVFEAESLVRLPTAGGTGRGPYVLLPSPDGRWLVGLTGPSIPVLAIFDLSGEGALVQEFPLTPMEPAGVGFAGAWLRDRFYLYMHYQGVPRLAGVDPATSPFDASSFLELDAGLSGVDRGELPRQFNVDALATGSWLYVYQRLGRWSKGDAREFIEGPVHGGIFVIDPGQGAVINHLAPSQDFWQVVTDEAESALYGLDAGNPEQGLPVRVLAVDANSGVVLRERALDDDVWSLSYATLPATIIPAGSVSAGPCRS